MRLTESQALGALRGLLKIMAADWSPGFLNMARSTWSAPVALCCLVVVELLMFGSSYTVLAWFFRVELDAGCNWAAVGLSDQLPVLLDFIPQLVLSLCKSTDSTVLPTHSRRGRPGIGCCVSSISWGHCDDLIAEHTEIHWCSKTLSHFVHDQVRPLTYPVYLFNYTLHLKWFRYLAYHLRPAHNLFTHCACSPCLNLNMAPGRQPWKHSIISQKSNSS